MTEDLLIRINSPKPLREDGVRVGTAGASCAGHMPWASVRVDGVALLDDMAVNEIGERLEYLKSKRRQLALLRWLGAELDPRFRVGLGFARPDRYAERAEQELRIQKWLDGVLMSPVRYVGFALILAWRLRSSKIRSRVRQSRRWDARHRVTEAR